MINPKCSDHTSRKSQFESTIHDIMTIPPLSKKIALMKLVEELKSHSSKWIKTKGQGYENFYWQDGYGAFSVSPSGVDKVIDYIANQHEHHRKISFQDEFREFLLEYEIEYDERYVWD
jgi:putative transposase